MELKKPSFEGFYFYFAVFAVSTLVESGLMESVLTESTLTFTLSDTAEDDTAEDDTTSLLELTVVPDSLHPTKNSNAEMATNFFIVLPFFMYCLNIL